ncbi:MAG: hypothetical protein GY827_12375 [Cytophagales bacterium]|nr:hypothetical protein [Cytophagales bacterium]
MKNILVLLLVISSFFASAKSYFEFNVGVASLDDEYFYGTIFPGTSFLYGHQFDLNKDIILDTEIGFALPSLATAKIGMGTYIDKEKGISIIFGVRPFPLHFYTQINLSERKYGQWIWSLEGGLGGGISFYSTFMATCGYRLTINKKKKKRQPKKEIQKYSKF